MEVFEASSAKHYFTPEQYVRQPYDLSQAGQSTNSPHLIYPTYNYPNTQSQRNLSNTAIKLDPSLSKTDFTSYNQRLVEHVNSLGTHHSQTITYQPNVSNAASTFGQPDQWFDGSHCSISDSKIDPIYPSHHVSVAKFNRPMLEAKRGQILRNAMFAPTVSGNVALPNAETGNRKTDPIQMEHTHVFSQWDVNDPKLPKVSAFLFGEIVSVKFVDH